MTSSAHTATSSVKSYEISGRTIELPVRIRHARQWSASWLVPARAAQAVIDYSGLIVAQPLPGRAVLALAAVDYLDGDLDTYHEVAVSILVRPHDAAPVASARSQLGDIARGKVGAFIHDLPVDHEFTRQAGTEIWGYPKWIAGIDLIAGHDRTACVVRADEGHQLTLTVRDGGPLPLPTEMPPTYSWRDGVLRRIEWEVTTEGGGSRPGGAKLVVGPRGPMATTLRRLGLPKRALMSCYTPHLTSIFGAPEVVEVRR